MNVFPIIKIKTKHTQNLEIDSCLDLSHSLKIAGSRPRLRQKPRSWGLRQGFEHTHPVERPVTHSAGVSRENEVRGGGASFFQQLRKQSERRRGKKAGGTGESGVPPKDTHRRLRYSLAPTGKRVGDKGDRLIRALVLK